MVAKLMNGKKIKQLLSFFEALAASCIPCHRTRCWELGQMFGVGAGSWREKETWTGGEEKQEERRHVLQSCFSSTKLTERIDTRKTNQPSKQIPCVVPPESKKWGGGRIMVD